jgi:hypothetical protein
VCVLNCSITLRVLVPSAIVCNLVLQHHSMYPWPATSHCVSLYCSTTLFSLVLQQYTVQPFTAASQCVCLYCSITLCVLTAASHLSFTAASHCESQHCNFTLGVSVSDIFCSFTVYTDLVLMCFGQWVYHEVSYMPFLRICWLTEADSFPPSSSEVTNKQQGSSTRLYGVVLNQHWDRT